MKNIFILTLFITQQLVGQIPYTIQNQIETRPEIGISFPVATNEELDKSAPDLLPKKVKYVDTIEGQPIQKEYLVEPTEAKGISRGINYNPDLSKAILKDGVKYLRILVTSKNAEKVDLLLKNVNLKEGESLYFYTSEKNDISQSYTQYNANDKKILSSPMFFSDHVILEYNSTNFDEVGSFEIEYLSHMYPDKILKRSISSRSGNCLYDVNCSDNDDYCNQTRSSNYIHVHHKNGKFYDCSGTLINNPNNDGTHYILTAQHCVEDFEMTNINILYAVPVVGAIFDWLFDAEVNIPIPIDNDRDIDVGLDDLRVYYNYQNPNCINDDNTIYGKLYMVSTGADWIRVSGYFMPPFNWSNDLAVIKMNRKPEYQWNVYYAGWTTETDRGGFEYNRVKSISRPGGRDKKFAEGMLNLTPFPSMWFVE